MRARILTYLGTAIMSTLLLLSMRPHANADTAGDKMTRAEIFLETGRPDRAAVILYELLGNTPDIDEQVQALYFLSEAMGALHRPDDRAALLLEAAELDAHAPYADDVRLARARIALEYGNYDDCIEQAAAFYENYPDSPLMPDMLTTAGEAYLRDTEYLRAFNTFNDIIKRYPDSGAARESAMKEGICLFHLNLTSGAIERFEHYLGMVHDGPNHAEALYYLGMAYEISNESAAAANAYRQVTVNYPGFDRLMDTFFRLGRVYFNTGKYAESENEFLNFVANTTPMNPNRDDALFYLERIKFRTGEYISEIQIAEQFAEKYPDSPRTPGLLFDLAHYYRVSGQLSAAVGTYLRIMSDARHVVHADSAACMIAETYYEHSEPDSATSFLREAIGASTNTVFSAALYHRLGLLSEREDRYDEAIAWYDSILVLDATPHTNFMALMSIGRTYGKLKWWYQASQTYERIIGEYSDHPELGETYAALAEVYYTQGRIRDAAHTAEMAVTYLGGQRRTELLFRIAELYEEVDRRVAMHLYRDISHDDKVSAIKRSSALMSFGSIALSFGDSTAAQDAYREIIEAAADSASVNKARQEIEQLIPAPAYHAE